MNIHKTHWSFWLITVFMLIWNAMGCMNFFVQMNPDMVTSYRETEQAIILDRPLWATVGFAFAVFGGTAGCILLLFKKTVAFYVFIASLIGAVIAVIHSLTLEITFGIGEIMGIIIMPVLLSIFLVWYSKHTQNMGWLKSS